MAGVADFNGDTHPDYLLFNAGTHGTVIWYMSRVTHTSSRPGPAIAAGYELVGTADFNSNGKPDYLLFNSTNLRTAIWYMNNNVRTGSAFGPTLPVGWNLAAP